MNMKYDLIPESCRVCLQRSKRLRSIYHPLQEGDEPPREMLRQVAGIHLDDEIDAETHLPNMICRSCELSLNMAYQFRNKAMKSQRIIELFGHQRLEVQQIIETEDTSLLVVKEELEEFIELNDYLDEDLLEESEEKVEYLDELYLDMDDYEMEQSDNDFIKSEAVVPDLISPGPSRNDDLNVNLEEQEQEILSIPNIKNPSKGFYQLSRTKDIPDNSWQHDTHEKKRKIKHESHICDICGNIYAKRGRMMEHRRRHNNELSYACELCDKRFNFREMLRKHMYMHSGGKPYKCSHCSRTFFYESVKKAHEAVHRGYKPYVCEECNKAFAYSHALKKHKLIHADIKLYHCEYCNKDFRLQHHMKQHEETKTHQNAVRASKMKGENISG